jgi:tetratricopeptide (TPR) repeat protein
MRLLFARATCDLYLDADKGGKDYASSLELALQLADQDYTLRTLWGCWACAVYIEGSYQASKAIAIQFRDFEKRYVAEEAHRVANRLTGVSALCLGDLETARDELNVLVRLYRPPVGRAHVNRYIYDQRAIGASSLAYALLQLGHTDEALGVAEECVERARNLQHLPSLQFTLDHAYLPSALLMGKNDSLADGTEELLRLMRRQAFVMWSARARTWKAILEILSGQANEFTYREAIRCISEIGNSRYFPSMTLAVSTISCASARAGLIAESLTLISHAIDHAKRSGDRCSHVEFARARAEILIAAGDPHACMDARLQLKEVVTTSREYHYRPFELRGWLLLARCDPPDRRSSEVLDGLSNLVEWFRGRSETADVREAKALLCAS